MPYEEVDLLSMCPKVHAFLIATWEAAAGAKPGPYLACKPSQLIFILALNAICFRRHVTIKASSATESLSYSRLALPVKLDVRWANVGPEVTSII